MNESEENPVPTEAPVEDASTEVAKYKDLALRAAADLDNYRKRANREKDDAIRYANSSLLEKLLPILDNFELGLEAAKTAPDAGAIVQGMSMVQKQLQDFLRDHGVEAIPSEGAVFDPNHHDAVAQENHPEIPEGHVVRQLRRGYRLKDRVLRASSVTVSKGPAE
ncbi:MAG: nucleotide exchange factor GrpE [Terrimicrobiaceae bacterium]|nr:nucleotide exchange factor GrpE [Terrimicrobiaceae bacterium]